jgi:hypothetical protein
MDSPFHLCTRRAKRVVFCEVSLPIYNHFNFHMYARPWKMSKSSCSVLSRSTSTYGFIIELYPNEFKIKLYEFACFCTHLGRVHAGSVANFLVKTYFGTYCMWIFSRPSTLNTQVFYSYICKMISVYHFTYSQCWQKMYFYAHLFPFFDIFFEFSCPFVDLTKI